MYLVLAEDCNLRQLQSDILKRSDCLKHVSDGNRIEMAGNRNAIYA